MILGTYIGCAFDLTSEGYISETISCRKLILGSESTKESKDIG